MADLKAEPNGNGSKVTPNKSFPYNRNLKTGLIKL